MYDVFSKIADRNNYIKTISRQHAAIHDGKMFQWISYGSYGANSTMLVYILTPNTTGRFHFTFQANTTLNNYRVSFTGAYFDSASTGYTALTAYNKDMNSTITTSVVCAISPTSSIFTDFTPTYEQWSLAGSGYVGSIGGGMFDHEWVLAPNSSYIVKTWLNTASVITSQVRIYEE